MPDKKWQMKLTMSIVVLAFAGPLNPAVAEGNPDFTARWEDLPEPERVEVMWEWEKEREAVERKFEALLMGERKGANGSAVLDAVSGLARLAIAEGDYEALPRRLDRRLDPEQLATVRSVVESGPAVRLVATLLDHRDLDYAHRELRGREDAMAAAEIMLVVRLLPALAAVQAEDGDFAAAYDTLTLLMPIADWLIEERPIILNSLIASAAIRESVRHIEELAQRARPGPGEIENLKAALDLGREVLDVASILKGEGAYAQWMATEDLHTWRMFAGDEYDDGSYWQILQEAADMAPWQRDASDWEERIGRTAGGIGGFLSPEIREAIDKLFETHFRIDLALEMLDFYADGTPPEFPPDPFTGEPLRWRESDEGCVVYSIGRNREDDGGVDRWTGKGHFDAVWRPPCDLIPPGLGEASTDAAS